MLFACGCAIREDGITGNYRLNNVGANVITLEIRRDRTFVQHIHLAGKSEFVASGAWGLNRVPATKIAPSSGKANFDPHAAATIYLTNAYSFENCPQCDAKRYDSVALPIERLLRIVILVEDPDSAIGYEKQ